jgi:DNA-binding transcriptional MerR regulator
MIMNEEEFLAHAGLKTQTLKLWLEQHWLIPERTSAGTHFSDMDVARARLIGELQTNFGVNEEGYRPNNRRTDRQIDHAEDKRWNCCVPKKAGND